MKPGYNFIVIFLVTAVIIIAVGLFIASYLSANKKDDLTFTGTKYMPAVKKDNLKFTRTRVFDAYPFQAGQWVTSKPITQADLQGKPYVLEFWATWCPPCKVSIPHMIELTKKYSDKITFIALSVDDYIEPVQKMVTSAGMNYNIAMDNGLYEKYDLQYIPTAFVVDSNSKVIWKGNPLDEDFEKAIQKLTKPSPAGGVAK